MDLKVFDKLALAIDDLHTHARTHTHTHTPAHTRTTWDGIFCRQYFLQTARENEIASLMNIHFPFVVVKLRF